MKIIKNKTSVGIIVPVYNAEKFLPRCIKSILNQTSTDWEAFLVNDGSTDNSLQLLYELIGNDSRFHIINKPNGGPASARNTGLKAAQTEYITFLDADDTLRCDFIEKTLRAALLNNCELVATGCVHLDTSYNIFKCYSFSSEGLLPFVPNVFFRSVIVAPWSKLYRKDIIDKYCIYFPDDMKVAEDFFFSAVYAMRIKNYYTIPAPLYEYNCINEDSLMRQFCRGNMPFVVYKLNVEMPWRVLQELENHHEMDKRTVSDFIYEMYSVLWSMYNVYYKVIAPEQKKEFTDFFKLKHEDFKKHIGFLKRFFLLERHYFIFRIVCKIKYYLYKLKELCFKR